MIGQGPKLGLLTNTPKISRYYLVNKSQYLNRVIKTMLFLILGHSIVPSDSATSGLHKTGFEMFGIKNLS